MVTIDQVATRDRAADYRERLAAVNWRELAVSVALSLPWLIGALISFVVAVGVWSLAAGREGYDAGTRRMIPPSEKSGAG